MFSERENAMELNEKIQQLRKQKGITQEELAEVLFVSRAAVSKWESGRGYPNIDSLKAIADYFDVTVDRLLSGDELLVIAEKDSRQKTMCQRSLMFSLLDCSAAMLFFLPFFGQKTATSVRGVSLLSLVGTAAYVKSAYLIVIAAIVLWGIAGIVLQNFRQEFRMRGKNIISLVLNVAGLLLFIITLQPYAAIFLFVFMAVKVRMLIKGQ